MSSDAIAIWYYRLFGTTETMTNNLQINSSVAALGFAPIASSRSCEYLSYILKYAAYLIFHLLLYANREFMAFPP